MPLEPMAEVAGRPMLGALKLLLGVDWLFGGAPVRRLPALLAASRKNQSEHGHGCWFQASAAGLHLACRQRLIWTQL